jgi:hypothetical protein
MFEREWTCGVGNKMVAGVRDTNAVEGGFVYNKYWITSDHLNWPASAAGGSVKSAQ